jgi:hypothetical protein
VDSTNIEAAWDTTRETISVDGVALAYDVVATKSAVLAIAQSGLVEHIRLADCGGDGKIHEARCFTLAECTMSETVPVHIMIQEPELELSQPCDSLLLLEESGDGSAGSACYEEKEDSLRAWLLRHRDALVELLSEKEVFLFNGFRVAEAGIERAYDQLTTMRPGREVVNVDGIAFEFYVVATKEAVLSMAGSELVEKLVIPYEETPLGMSVPRAPVRHRKPSSYTRGRHGIYDCMGRRMKIRSHRRTVVIQNEQPTVRCLSTTLAP